jgi:hypothetical protein
VNNGEHCAPLGHVIWLLHSPLLSSRGPDSVGDNQVMRILHRGCGSPLAHIYEQRSARKKHHDATITCASKPPSLSPATPVKHLNSTPPRPPTVHSTLHFPVSTYPVTAKCVFVSTSHLYFGYPHYSCLRERPRAQIPRRRVYCIALFFRVSLRPRRSYGKDREGIIPGARWNKMHGQPAIYLLLCTFRSCLGSWRYWRWAATREHSNVCASQAQALLFPSRLLLRYP